MSKITIKEIARLANVTPAAVSYVINDRPGVSDEKRKAIQKIIAETGYIPNLSSQKLVRGKSFNIHVVVGSANASFDNLFYNSAIKRMMDVCSQHRYNLVLSSTETFAGSALERSIMQKDVDGVVFLQSVIPDAAVCLREKKIPYVILDAHELSDVHNSIYCDYAESAHKATSYLLEQGHRSIGFIGTDSIREFFDSACAGYQKALTEHGVTPSDDWVFSSGDTQEIDDNLVTSLSSKSLGLTAVLCITDILAVNFLRACESSGISVPRDISVCGIDDILISKYCSPALTTLEIDKFKMGENAIHLLLKMMGEESPLTGQNICIQSGDIIERNSVAKQN